LLGASSFCSVRIPHSRPLLAAECFSAAVPPCYPHRARHAGISRLSCSTLRTPTCGNFAGPCSSPRVRRGPSKRGLQHKRQLAPRAAPVMGDWDRRPGTGAGTVPDYAHPAGPASRRLCQRLGARRAASSALSAPTTPAAAGVSAARPYWSTSRGWKMPRAAHAHVMCAASPAGHQHAALYRLHRDSS